MSKEKLKTSEPFGHRTLAIFRYEALAFYPLEYKEAKKAGITNRLIFEIIRVRWYYL